MAFESNFFLQNKLQNISKVCALLPFHYFILMYDFYYNFSDCAGASHIKTFQQVKSLLTTPFLFSPPCFLHGKRQKKCSESPI